MLELGISQDIILRTVNCTWASTTHTAHTCLIKTIWNSQILVINNNMTVYGQECESRHNPWAIKTFRPTWIGRKTTQYKCAGPASGWHLNLKPQNHAPGVPNTTKTALLRSTYSIFDISFILMFLLRWVLFVCMSIHPPLISTEPNICCFEIPIKHNSNIKQLWL
jgi:hypothetical protein